MRRTVRTLLILLPLLVAAALAQNLGYAPDPDWRPPQQAVERANPLSPTPAIVGGGGKLFRRHCAQCHGEDGSGRKNAADLQLPVVQERSDGALFWRITNGNPRRGMPSFDGLPEMQRWQLVLYLRTLGAANRDQKGTQ